jgi:hypothetical protein
MDDQAGGGRLPAQPALRKERPRRWGPQPARAHEHRLPRSARFDHRQRCVRPTLSPTNLI